MENDKLIIKTIEQELYFMKGYSKGYNEGYNEGYSDSEENGFAEIDEEAAWTNGYSEGYIDAQKIVDIILNIMLNKSKDYPDLEEFISTMLFTINTAFKITEQAPDDLDLDDILERVKAGEI